MDEIKEIANYMEIAMKDCSKCPLENICETDCSGMWERFLRSKLKGDEIEE